MLDSSAINGIVSLLEPEMRDERTRRSLLDVVFMGAPSRPDIDPAGASVDATRRIVLALAEFGELQPGQPALWALCEAILPQIGLDRQARLQAYRDAIHAPPPVAVSVPDEAPRHHSVFVSYARHDRDFVQKLGDDLQAQDLRVWVDHSGLKPGTRSWENALRGAIRDAYAVLMVASPDARQSNYVQAELAIAEMYGCPVIPVWVRGDHWIDAVPMEMAKAQYVDLRAGADYAANLSVLVGRLKELHAKATGEQPAVSATPFQGINPFKGLRPFTDDDARFFFGRERLVEELAAAVMTEADAARFLAVVGASGSGKSSVVMAGLVPRLRERESSSAWAYLPPLVPGARPLEALANALAERLGLSARTVREDLDNPDGRGLHLLAERVAQREKAPRVVLYFDQFEEIFTLTENEDERRQVVDLIVKAASEPRGAALIILTLRADFYDRPMQYPALGRLLEAHSKSVLPMDVSDLRAAIEKPAALVGLGFEDGLVGDLLFEVRDQPGALPLLQFTLDQLYRHCVIQDGGERLVMSAYREIGGVRGALAQHAEATYAQLPDDAHRALARGLFLNLIEPGATEQDTPRRRAPAEALVLADAAQTTMLAAVAEAFTQARLLVTSRVGDAEMIEVSHEALIREWARLRDWLKEARTDLGVLRSLRDDTRGWIERGRQADDAGLLRGSVLREAEGWAARSTPSADQAAFIEASAAYEATQIALEERRKQELIEAEGRARAAAEEATRTAAAAQQASVTADRQRVRARVAIVAAIVIGAVTLFSGVSAINTVRTADMTLLPLSAQIAAANGQLLAAQMQGTQAAADVMNSRALFAASLSSQQLAQGSPQNALLLALESLKDYPAVYNVESQQALSAALASPLQEWKYFPHENAVSGASWSPDQRRVVTWSGDFTAKIWSLDGGDPIILPHDTAVNGALWSKDGQRVLTWDDRIHVWTLDGGVSESTLDGSAMDMTVGFSTLIAGATWSADEQRVLMWSYEGGSKIVPLDGGDPVPLSTADRMVNRSGLWSPDETHILELPNYEPGEIYTLDGGRVVGEPTLVRSSSGSEIAGGAWSPDGTRLVLWSVADYTSTATLDVVSVDDRAEPLSLPADGLVIDAKWSRDGTRILFWTQSAYPDQPGTAVVWTLDGSEAPIIMEHDATVSGATWNADETRVLTWSEDTTARVWFVDGGRGSPPFILRHDGFVDGAQWSADERQVLTWSGDTVHVWELGDNVETYRMRHDGRVTGASWGIGDAVVLSWSEDGSARLWELYGGAEPFKMNSDSYVQGAGWNPDESRIFTASDSGWLRVWTPGNPEGAQGLPFESGVFNAAWSPDGTRLLGWSQDYTARVWTPGSDNAPIVLQHEGGVYGGAWSKDGQRVLTWSYDGTARVWTLDGSAEPIILRHDGYVSGAQWSKDETRVLTWGFDGKPRVWTLDGSAEPIILQADVSLSEAAWSPDETHVMAWQTTLTADGGNFVYVWALDGSTSAPRKLEHGGWVVGATWSKDSTRILSWAMDGTAAVWSLDEDTPPVGYWLSSPLAVARWNADETRVLMIPTYGGAEIWTVDGSAAPIKLSPGDNMSDGWWSPDGTRVLSVGFETARLWSLDRPDAPMVLQHDGSIVGAAFNHDGSRVLTWSEDSAARVWIADLSELIAYAQGQRTRDLTESQRQTFFLPSLVPTAVPLDEFAG